MVDQGLVYLLSETLFGWIEVRSLAEDFPTLISFQNTGKFGLFSLVLQYWYD